MRENTLLGLALKTARYAAGIVKKDFSGYRRVEHDLTRDVKIAADFALDEIIVQRLFDETGFPVLSEEGGMKESEKRTSAPCWIVDSLDGSFNFSRGIPINCISIALWKKNEPLLGVVHDFNREETFSGMAGGGARLNGRSMRVSSVKGRQNSLLCTGFPVSTDFSEPVLLDFVRNIAAFRKIRLLGSAALSLAYVACGRADMYVEHNIKIWDVAAGIALVRAAGGEVRFTSAVKRNVLNVTATNGFL